MCGNTDLAYKSKGGEFQCHGFIGDVLVWFNRDISLELQLHVLIWFVHFALDN